MGAESPRLPGLNGLRFLAALAVFTCHVEQIKGFHSLQSWFGEPGVRRLGPLGVTFFFVLSGFLITRVLLRELGASGVIDVKRFYWRRMLRIWPVYYLVTALAFFAWPAIRWLDIRQMPPVHSADFFGKLALFLAMSAHVSQTFLTDVAYGGALWSTSVEEHFYLFWPHVLKGGRKRLPWVLAGIIVLMVLLKNGYYFSVPDAFWWPVKQYFDSFRIDCMAIGAMGAIVSIPGFLFRRDFQLATIGLLLGLMLNGTQFQYFDDEVYSFLFLVVLLNVAENPLTLLKLRGPAFEAMGRISYGFYAYQWICIAVVVKLFLASGAPREGLGCNLVIYAGSFAATALVSWISYVAMERPILNLKRSYRGRPAG